MSAFYVQVSQTKKKNRRLNNLKIVEIMRFDIDPLKFKIQNGEPFFFVEFNGTPASVRFLFFEQGGNIKELCLRNRDCLILIKTNKEKKRVLPYYSIRWDFFSLFSVFFKKESCGSTVMSLT